MSRELPDNEYMQLLARDHPEFRERLLAWFRANDIDPNHIPAGERPSLVDGQLTLRMFDLDAEGRRQIDPAADRVLTRTITVPMKVPPADAQMARWLTPPCSECGR